MKTNMKYGFMDVVGMDEMLEVVDQGEVLEEARDSR